MTKRKDTRSSSLFLLELLIAILFFSVASSICIQIFVKSHTLSEDTEQLNHALFQAESVAEIINRAESFTDAESRLNQFYPESSSLSDLWEVCFDENWIPSSSQESSYRMCVVLSEENRMLTAAITVTDSQNTLLYTLDVSHYLQRRLEDE